MKSLPVLILLLAASIVLADPPFDWNRARELHARAQRGEVLNDADRKYLDEAIRRHNAGEPIGGGPATPAGPTPVPVLQWSGHLTPLTELKEPYHGQDGGLYGGGKNEPAPAQAALANQALAQIQPLDAEGHPSPSGKIALLSIGMSNTTMEFSAFLKDADADPRKAASVVVVDGAQGGKDAPSWSKSDSPPWQIANQRLTAAGVTPRQVQAIWIMQAIAHPTAGFPKETERLRDYLRDIVTLAKQKYPNLRIAYLSSRIYGGYAVTPLNPEPYAYEGAFAVRWLIEQQTKGDPALNATPEKGEVKAPVLLWGPYLWADGQTPRQSDHLTYIPSDLRSDGTHPSPTARAKVAHLLLEFFATNPLAKPWYLRK